MKVLIINGSPRENGNTKAVLSEMANEFLKEGIEVKFIEAAKEAVAGCLGCGYCSKNGKCIKDDAVNEAAKDLEECDGVVIGSPVYYASPNGSLLAFLDRLFYSTSKVDKRMKVGASFAVARRGGTTAAFDVLNKYFTISEMPIASSRYWNIAHGARPGEVLEDKEGMQTARILAKNMIFLMRSIELGRKAFGLPEAEKKERTNFIR